MAGSITKPRKPKSKRTTTRLRNKIQKASASKQRKQRKQAGKSAQWKSKHKKDPGIPNSFPFKEQLLEEIEQAKLRKQEEARLRKEAAKAARTGAIQQQDEPVKTDEDEDGLSEDGQEESDVEMMDEDNDGNVDESNPMAALLASARAAADKYQRDLESGNNRENNHDDDDDDDDDDGDDDSNQGDETTVPQASSRKQYDKVFKQVVDEADVVLYVLDARDPEGTRSREVERSVMAAASGGKRLILILNKVDLIPPNVLKGWLVHLRRFFPTLPLRASGSAANAKTFNHGDLTPQRTAANLFHALKSFSANRNLKRAISVGVVGYPNVGKSSVINALMGRHAGKGGKASNKACPAGAEAGVTTSIRTVKIDSKLTLLDSPGIVFPSNSGPLVSPKNAIESHANLVLLNAIPARQIDDPIPAVNLLLRRLSTSPELMGKLAETYGIPPLLTVGGDPTTDFLVQVARKRGRLGKGGVPNINAAAMTVVTDWRDGRIQGWTEPPILAVAGMGTEESQAASGATGVAEGAAPDEKVIVTEWAKEFKIEGLWGDADEEMQE